MKVPCFLAIVLLTLAPKCQGQPSRDKVRDTINRAMLINELQRDVQELHSRELEGSPEAGTLTCAHMLANVHKRQYPKKTSQNANILFLATRLLMNDGYSLEELQTKEVLDEFSARQVIVEDVRPETCNRTSPYRTANGTCNNLDKPSWGMAGSIQKRCLPPAYADNVGMPRNSSVDGVNKALPNPREISNRVHSGPLTRMSTVTLHVFQMGQFLDHDLIKTPGVNSTVDCCKDVSSTLKDYCIPIKINGPDEIFPNGTCMDVKRSEVYIDKPGVRQQGNALTSYIDASNVYGSSLEEQLVLRDGAFMRTKNESWLPDDFPNSACASTKYNCSLAGDSRSSVVPSLTSYHVTFVRLHNLIAKYLEAYYPNDEETLFQETRRIVIAIMQKIVYDEFLPSFMSPAAMALYRLRSSSTYKYEQGTDATVTNCFGIAFRCGHGWIPRDMSIFNRKLWRLAGVDTEKSFLNPDLTYMEIRSQNELVTGLNGLSYWLSGADSPVIDGHVTAAARNFLFLDKKGRSLDLVALNIQRGRDHGLPSYTEFRTWCGLSNVTTFNELTDHSNDTVNKLRIYSNPCDIDLFTGVMTEIHSEGAEIGPTLQCILGRQFEALKYGDRFWYQGTTASFSEKQLAEIQKVSMSRVLCDTMDFKKIHRNAFLTETDNNPIVNCNAIPQMDLSVFKPKTTTAASPSASGQNQAGQGNRSGNRNRQGRQRELENILKNLLDDLENGDV